MKVRTFHQLESDNSGLDIFVKWANSPKKPINDTDISLVFEGKEYVDTELDYIAVGKVMTPCLTAENLIRCVKSMDNEQRMRLKEALEDIN